MKKRLLGVILALAAVLTLLSAPSAAAATSWISGHVQNRGWIDGAPSIVVDGATWVGTVDSTNRLEAVRLNNPAEAAFTMRGHVQNVGWVDQQRLPDGRVMVGTTGRSLRLEAVQLTPMHPEVWTVWCQANVAGKGWLDPVKNGATCGTTGESRKVLTMRIWVTPTDTPTSEPTVPPTTEPTTEPTDVTRIATVGDIGPEGADNLAAIGKTGRPLLLLGDLGYTISAQAFCDMLKARVQAPVMWVQGNHENRNAKAADQLTTEYQKCMPGYADSYGDVGIAQVYKTTHAWFITGSPNEAEPGAYLPGGARWVWMRDQIRAAHAAGVFAIVAVHEPDYTVGEHGRPSKESEQKAISNLAEAEGVKLVLTGHDHNYSRVQPRPGSPVFIVAGMGGHEVRPVADPNPLYKACPGNPGYLTLDITADRITGHVVGTCQDDFTITKG